MSDLPSDRRRRIGWRWPVAIICVTLGLLARGAVYYHRTITPPDCTDPRTLALVHDSLTGHFKLPDTAGLEMIRTLRGAYLVFRYLCKVWLTGFDGHVLPSRTTIPGWAGYVSHLTDGGRRHEVPVLSAHLMILEQVP